MLLAARSCSKALPDEDSSSWLGTGTDCGDLQELRAGKQFNEAAAIGR
jgi:hypothetical protein